MIYKPGYLRKRSKPLISARKWGVSLITGFLGLGLFISEVQRIQKLPLDLINYTYLVLFVLTGLLIFLWIWATQKELDLLFEWLDPERYEPPSGFKETAIIIGLALLLIGLLFASRNPLLYGCIFTIHSLAVLFAWKYVETELATVFEKSKSRIEAEQKDGKLHHKANVYLEGIGVLEFYFCKRPHIPRLIVIFVFALTGLALSAYWKKLNYYYLGSELMPCLF